MALKNGELYASFGNMGGFMQPQGHVSLLHSLRPQIDINSYYFSF